MPDLSKIQSTGEKEERVFCLNQQLIINNFVIE